MQLLTSAVQQLDTHAVLLVLLNSLIDCSGAFPMSLWDTLLEEIPTRFSHLQFGPVFERGKGRSGALFTGVDRSAHCLPGSESLETRACVMREVLTMCRGASPRIGDSCPAITPRSCEGSLCCEISSGAAPDALYDTQYWSSMDAYELTSHYWVSYVLDTVGSSALGGLILLVRQRDIESPGGITEPPPASRAGSTPQPFSLASVSKVLSVSGEWMDPRHLYSKPRGTWCSNYEQTENRPRPIQLVDASDRFLCMPSGVIDPKLVALRSKLGWIKASLHSNSVSCNRSIDRVLRANSGGCLAAVLLEDGKGLDRTDCGLFYAAQCGNYEVDP